MTIATGPDCLTKYRRNGDGQGTEYCLKLSDRVPFDDITRDINKLKDEPLAILIVDGQLDISGTAGIDFGLPYAIIIVGYLIEIGSRSWSERRHRAAG